MADSNVRESEKCLQLLSKPSMGVDQRLDNLTIEGLQVIQARKGFIRCHFVVTDRVLDPDGNWHAGAIATLIDSVGACSVYSVVGLLHVSVDFNISYHQTAKIQEEVEIEAKVIGKKGKLTSVVVEVRRKNDGKLIALGHQWMAPTTSKLSLQWSKL